MAGRPYSRAITAPCRHADVRDPRKLPQVCALAADDRHHRLVDFLEIQRVETHPLSSLGVPAIHSDSLFPMAAAGDYGGKIRAS